MIVSETESAWLLPESVLVGRPQISVNESVGLELLTRIVLTESYVYCTDHE